MVQPGRRIGEYVVERELGRGGMGIVYSAVHAESAERVAVKVISPQLLPDPQQRRRFQREARAAAQLQHSGLVRIFGHGDSEGTGPYILMEYLDGASLRQVLQAAPSHRLEVTAAVLICRQLAEVLDSAHATGLLHRDVKPSNVMLLGDVLVPSACRVKLLDFGLARLLSEGEGVTISESAVIGTPAYMSPEQCEGRSDLDGRSDVYGLGALLFETLCGRPPFVGPPPRMMYQHVYESAPPAEKYRPELSPALSGLVSRMLAKAATDRPTMAEVAAQLREQRQSAEPPLNPLQVAAPSRSGKARLGIGIGIGILFLVSAALLAAQRHAQDMGVGKAPPVAADIAASSGHLAPPPPRVAPAAVAPQPAARPDQTPANLLPDYEMKAAVPETLGGVPKPAAADKLLRLRPPQVGRRVSQKAAATSSTRAPLAAPSATDVRDAAASPDPLLPTAEPPPAPTVSVPAAASVPAPAPVPSSVRPRVEYWK